MTSSNTTANSSPDAPLKGMSMAIIGMFMLPGMDIVSKILSSSGALSPGFLTFARFVFLLIVSAVLGLVLGGGISSLQSKRFGLNFLRGALIAIASVFFFAAIKYMPLADAIAVFFVEPLILTSLSVLVLKETIGWRRITAVIIGFIGALIVVQPSYSVLGPVSLLPLVTAGLFSSYLLLNRIVGKQDNIWSMQFNSAIGSLCVLILVMILGTMFGVDDLAFTMPTATIEWSLLGIMGAVGMAGHFIVLRAFQLAPASLLAPFQYVEIVSAVILGLIFFGDFPTPSKWLGIFIIVASGLYVFAREHRLGKRVKKPV